VKLPIALGCVLVLSACTSARPVPPLAPTFDACTLLTPADFKDVQGEESVDTKSSEQTSGAVVIHQCFFRLADFSKSISVSAGTVGRAYWKRMFAERAGSEEEEERHGKADVKRPVRGIGDEAYWLASPVGGTLYVRDGGNMLRLAVGGKGSDAERLAKATNLARRALARITK
jgi:hypothetical protein